MFLRLIHRDDPFHSSPAAFPKQFMVLPENWSFKVCEIMSIEGILGSKVMQTREHGFSKINFFNEYEYLNVF